MIIPFGLKLGILSTLAEILQILFLPIVYYQGNNVKKNAKILADDAVNRIINGKVAAALLVAFETNPEHWASIHYINEGKAKEDIPFEEYLKNWLDESPKKHHIFIHSIARRLGISL